MASVQQMIVQAAIAQGVDPNLALAVAFNESGYNQGAIGSRGEVGVFQLMPTTAQQLGVDPSNLQSNINGGVAYLKQQLGSFGNDPAFALAAYNAGPAGNFDSAQVTGYVNTVMDTYNKYAGQDYAGTLAPSSVVTVDSSSVPDWLPLAAIAAVVVIVIGSK